MNNEFKAIIGIMRASNLLVFKENFKELGCKIDTIVSEINHFFNSYYHA